MSARREHDLVLYGATGFVGRLVAEHLALHAPAGTTIALAGRSQQRLEDVRAGLPAAAANWPLVVADAADASALAGLAAATTCVATTVGPYTKYGLPLVEACAAAGTHYADLTGEPLFVRACIDAAHEQAMATGARIVPSCGFDSIPSDLGVMLLAERAAQDGAGTLEDTTLVVASLRGGISGGSIDSSRTQVDQIRADPSLGRRMGDRYLLSPDREAEPTLPEYPEGFLVEQLDGRWVAPFVMAQHNSRIVRRSNALQGWSYGRTFRYREVLSTGRSLLSPAKAVATSVVLGLGFKSLGFGPTRRVLDRVLPSPGEGPDQRTRESGRFRFEIYTVTTSGRRYVATVAAQGDPGYAATAVMLGQSGLCLALDGTGADPSLPDRAGVLTPATAMGHALVDRLHVAGFTLEVTEV